MVNQAKRRRIAVNRGMTLVRCLQAQAKSIKSYVDFVASGSGSLDELEKLVKGWEDGVCEITGQDRSGRDRG
jgi:hypothetical protein